MEQNTLTLLDADRIAVPQHLAVNAEEIVADFVTLGAVELFIGLFADVLQLPDRSAGKKIHLHVAALAERRQELLERQEDLAIVGTRIVRRLDIDRAGLPSVGPETEIIHRNDMGVVETESRWLRHKGDAAHAVGWNVRRALLSGAININGNELAVPVELLRRVGIVVNIDEDLLAFRKAHQRPGKLAIVERG